MLFIPPFCFFFSFKANFLLFFVDEEQEELIKEAESKNPEELTQDEKMALLGRPRLGDTVKAQLRVKESKEFKVNFLRLLSLSPLDDLINFAEHCRQTRPKSKCITFNWNFIMERTIH